MGELLLKIYEQVVSEDKSTYQGRKRVEECVEELIRKHVGDFGQEEAQAVRELAYAAGLKAEQQGFQLGVQFAIRLFLELYPGL